MSEHTPGPWRLWFKNNEHGIKTAFIYESGYDGISIAYVTDRTKAKIGEPYQIHDGSGPGMRYEQREYLANAKLIAAAPDLLRACRGDNWCGNTPGYFHQLLKMLELTTPKSIAVIEMIQNGQERIAEIEAAIKKATE